MCPVSLALWGCDRSQANRELQEILENIAEEDKQAQEAFGFADLLSTPALRQILLLACMLQAIQQLSGINTVMYNDFDINQIRALFACVYHRSPPPTLRHRAVHITLLYARC